ncbi:uncharacterized protein LOC127809785 isoform X1 [Diospyros lotus]|uniref:uncharacterized protein LOC127809785 isoform X1 n=1 Tax=Diospyros lotus TaxID=55363 RepID=UPI00225A5E6F|nr:uncharacterized protein LOC127809785 isoform X1 [Diospyros lotus]
MIGLARCQEPSDSYMLKILTPKSELEIFTLHYGKYISHSRWCFLWRSKRKIGCGQHWTYFLGGISMKCGEGMRASRNLMLIYPSSPNARKKKTVSEAAGMRKEKKWSLASRWNEEGRRRCSRYCGFLLE